jgi:ankyrin repeat protein
MSTTPNVVINTSRISKKYSTGNNYKISKKYSTGNNYKISKKSSTGNNSNNSQKSKISIQSIISNNNSNNDSNNNSNKNNTQTNLVSCNDYFGYFNNSIGTCWMISTFMIILMNNKTALNNLSNFNEKLFKTKLLNKQNNSNNHQNYKYLQMLPLFCFTNDDKTVINDKYIELFINFFTSLKERLMNKKLQAQMNSKKKTIHSEMTKKIILKKKRTNNHSLFRIKSIESLNQITKNTDSQSCELQLSNSYKKMFKPSIQPTLTHGGNNFDPFMLQLIISIFLCNELYNYNLFYMNNLDLQLDFDNIIGINIGYIGHSMSFYRCNNKLMFSNNFLTKELNWINLLNYIKNHIKYFNNREYKLLFIDKTFIFIIQINDKFYKFKDDLMTELIEINDDNPELLNFRATEKQEMHEKLNITTINCLFKLKKISKINKFYFITKIKLENDILSYINNYYPYYLHFYFNTHNVEYINKILEGVDINKKYINDDLTALIIASTNINNKDIVELLINKGCDLNIQNNEGNTALMMAISYEKNKDIVELLINKGCDLNIQNKSGKTALIMAIEKSKDNENSKKFDYKCNLITKINKGKIDTDNKNNKNNKEIVEIVELLINKGCNLNIKDNDGHTALMIAANNINCKEIVKLILKNCCNLNTNCDLNLQDYEGNTALMFAVSKINNIDIVELILNNPKCNFKINVKNKTGESAIMFAVAQDNNQDIVRSLLSRKDININITDGDGETALMNAVYNNNKNYVKLLIDDPRCKVDLLNKNGDTAFMIAIKQEDSNKKEDNNKNAENKEIIKLLLEHSKKHKNSNNSNNSNSNSNISSNISSSMIMV